MFKIDPTWEPALITGKHTYNYDSCLKSLPQPKRRIPRKIKKKIRNEIVKINGYSEFYRWNLKLAYAVCRMTKIKPFK